MIKVNLLRDQTVKVGKKVVRSTISRMGLVVMAAFLVMAGALGMWWYSLDREVNRLAEERDRLRQEEIRLQQLKKEISEFEKLKRLRESKIQVIEKLKENQTGPVLLLNHVIQSIPSGPPLWLTLIDQKGEKIQIIGHAQRSESIPEFMSKLAATGYFKSVDLELMEDNKEVSKFSLMCISRGKPPTE